MKELRFGALRGMSSLWPQQEPPQEASQEEQETYSQEDVELLLAQKEAEWQSRQEAAVQAARSEAERLLSMTDEERAQEQLRAQAAQELAASQLPAELLELLDYADAERCSASIETVERLVRQAVQQGVERRVAGSAPRSGGDAQGRQASLRDAISNHYSL